MNRNEFNLLTYLERNENAKIAHTQRSLAKVLDVSVGLINKTISSLIEKGLLNKEYQINAHGQKALEPYRVKRAVFLAAGFGSRLMPISLNTPKPLVKVNGSRMIDTLIRAVVAAEIKEIIVVRGYLAEQFDQLLYDYPGIEFVYNKEYNETNNISSAMCVREELENTYVFEGDLVLSNPDLIRKYEYTSNYLGVPVDRTDDWCFQSKNGIITGFDLGGKNCHHMYGLSYWNKSDGARLAADIKSVYNMPGGKERFWDCVPLEYYIENYNIEIRECTFSDIVEIDTYKDLQAIDASYLA